MPSGVSTEQAAANLNAVFSAAVQGTIQVKPKEHIPTLLVEDGSHGLNPTSRDFAQPLHVLFGLTALMLLMACAKIANLMLSRATTGEREMSVRLALGAGRARVLRQTLTESLLLATLGGSGGLLLGYVGRSLLPDFMQAAWQGEPIHIAFDWPIFAFTAVLALGTGLLFGLLPALCSSTGDLGVSLKQTGRSASRRRGAWTGKLIVAFQIALSTLLVAASVLFLRTLLNLNQVHPGFRTAGLLEIELAPPAKRYPGRRSVEVTDQIEQALSAVPGVQAVTFADPPFLNGSQTNDDFNPEGLPPRHLAEDHTYPSLSNVGEHFFSVLNIPILRGRNFGPQDTASANHVAIINQATARRYFATLDPIGRRFTMSDDPQTKIRTSYTIVGVCVDTLHEQIRARIQPLHFELYRQNKDTSGGTFILRTDANPVPTLRRVVQHIVPDLPLTNIRPLQEQSDANLDQDCLFASLTTGFGILALLLACIGIYGMAYKVTQRTNEIGIRLALGARRGQVRTMVLRESVWLALAGVTVGLATILALVQLVKTMLYGLQPRDPFSLAGTAFLLFSVAFIAALATRSTRCPPGANPSLTSRITPSAPLPGVKGGGRGLTGCCHKGG